MDVAITIKNFKSLSNITLEPGRVNVFIGANGTGKSALLEAIGVLSAAISDKVDDAGSIIQSPCLSMKRKCSDV
ncbi:AAA ATPase-like protein [Cohnella sp. SGD-V74]|uniref:AAA family ATPase n=1 Tax=unclassified Cohnella TaxID=2636738 RepID=UPI000D0650C1|nr:AAA ATPase-like protein [Cohnella sp. SGD-V74]